MLKFFRKKHIAKIIFWGLVILIMPAFVLWGTGSFSRGKDKGPSYAGTIDNKKVSFEELFESLQGIRGQIVLNYFNDSKVLDELLKNRSFLARAAWDRLIMLKEAKKYKITVPDRQVIAYIRSHPIFSRGGAFDSRIYEYVLRYNMGMSARNFEEAIRENMTIQKLKDIITKDIKVTDEEILNAYKMDNEKFKISYILVERKDFLDKVTIDEQAMSDYYEGHKVEFLLPQEAQDKQEATFSNYEDVRTSIKSYLAEQKAKELSVKYTEDLHKKMKEAIEKENLTFEDAASKLGLKILESQLFSKTDYIEGIGEAAGLVFIAFNLEKPDKMSPPIETRSGAMIFKIKERTGIDEEKYKKDKEEYSKKVLEEKRGKALDKWFNQISLRIKLKIDLNNIDKYYR